MAKIDPALMQVLDLPQRTWKPDVQHYREVDGLGIGFEGLERDWCFHYQPLRNLPAPLKQS